MLTTRPIRIDMSLTDDHIYNTIKKLIPRTKGLITYEQIAEASGCGLQTAFRSTRRLASAGRIVMSSGSGRRPISYEVKEDAQTHMD